MHINPDTVSAKDIYKLLTSTVTPRPIAWVSTINQKGGVNLAPFSFFNIVSVAPPVLGFSPLLDGNGQRKDTLNNIESTGEFVVNIVGPDTLQQMNQTSASYASDINEMAEVGLTEMASCRVSPPSVKEALVHFECTLHDIVPFGDDPLAGSLILGSICHIHLDDTVYDGNYVDVTVLDTVGRMEGSCYTRTRDRLELKRPVSVKTDTGQ
ncbi:flavin reductase family protein [Endozoicomonas sp. Mp262]|uniref:flavin reductase family protein n=1 Tax=Endozoicomonas sp. Mp262 TaxID=2919499 RepID=UPI0021DF9C00